DQLALAHARGAPDAEAGCDLLQLGQHHALEDGTAAPPGAGTGGRRGSVRGGRGSGLLDTCAHQIGGVAHEGSFPGADVGLSGSATGCAVRLRSSSRTVPGRWSASAAEEISGDGATSSRGTE